MVYQNISFPENLELAFILIFPHPVLRVQTFLPLTKFFISLKTRLILIFHINLPTCIPSFPFGFSLFFFFFEKRVLSFFLVFFLLHLVIYFFILESKRKEGKYFLSFNMKIIGEENEKKIPYYSSGWE